MKDFLEKIWLPLLLVTIAAVQSFGLEAGRLMRFRHSADSLELSRMGDSSYIMPAADTLKSADSSFIYDSTKVDSIGIADTSTVTDTLTAADTIKIPDSLEFTDPFKFKYYIAIKDSTTRFIVRDSLMMAGDTLELHKLDFLYVTETTETAQA